MRFKREIVGIILCIAATNLLFGVTKIKSDSMVPVLRDGDWVFYFRYSSPRKFGIFFIDDPQKEGRSLVKRIIALPGERTKNYRISYVIPADHYFVLGDNREIHWENDLGEAVISRDSRSFGSVHRSFIHERVVAVLWPPGHARCIW